MTELANTTESSVSLLDNLAAEARTYSEGVMFNLLQLGRVYTEAKKLVKHGEWGDWLRENSGVSERTAQQFMAVYARFGSKPVFSGIEKSKLFKMLSLPAGEEERFAEEYDIANMTSREVEAAVKQARAEMQAEIDRERAARMDADRRAAALTDRPAEIPQEVIDQMRAKDDEIERQDEEIRRIEDTARDYFDEMKKLEKQNAALQRDLREQEEMLEDVQRDYDRAQSELLSMKSEAAKGDAERIPSDALTVDVLASAVQQFIGTCARLPHMGIAFSMMTSDVKDAYNELLSTIEAWARDSRKAFNTSTADGRVIIDE